MSNKWLTAVKFAGDWGAAAGVDQSVILVVGRKVSDVDAQHLRAQGKTPRQAAEWLVNDQRPTYEANPHIVYWEGNNEPVWEDLDGMAWYAQMEIERMKVLDGMGLKAVIGNFSTGSPPLWQWAAFVAACQYAHDHDHILGLHEYSRCLMFWMTGAYQMDSSEDCRTSDGRLAGWTFLRYRQVYDQYLNLMGIGDLPLVITEYGLDGLVNPCPEHWPAAAFRGLGNFWHQGPEHWGVPLPDDFVPEGGWHYQYRDRFYFEQLWWADQHLRQDDFVIAPTIFSWGSFSGTPWEAFDINGTAVPGYLAEYISASFEEAPPLQEVPVADHFDAPVGDSRCQAIPPPWWTSLGYCELHQGSWHTGIDFNKGSGQDDYGEPVHAVADGRVAYKGTPSPAWGKVFAIEHLLPDGRRIWSRYAHLSSFTDFKVGDVVWRGDLIGRVGDAGGRYSSHLHCDLTWVNMAERPWDWPGADRGRVETYYVDPLKWIESYHPEEDLNPFGHCLVGVGTADPHPLEQLDWDTLAVANVELVKVLCPGQSVGDVQRLIQDGRVVIARLFSNEPGNKVTSAAEFVAEVGPAFETMYDAGVRYFELHNEPNLPQEGYGVSWANGSAWANWFLNALSYLRARRSGALIGYPGLSPQFEGESGLPSGCGIWRFLDASEAAVQVADWVGVHGYWWYPGDGHWGMLDPQTGMLWRQLRDRFPDKLLFITEFSNNSLATSYADKGNQYVDYYALLRHERNLAGAVAFALYWPGQDVNREGWRNDGGMTDIPGIVGKRRWKRRRRIGWAAWHTRLE